MEKVEAYLEKCRLILYQLKNSENKTEEEITSRYLLVEHFLNSIDEELGVSSKKNFEGFIERLSTFDNLIEKSNFEKDGK